MANLVNLVYDSLQLSQRSLSGRCVYKESGSVYIILDRGRRLYSTAR